MVIFGEYNTSVKRAFEEIDKNWQKYNGVVICGTHNPDDYDIEDLIDKIKWAREFGIPLYGECWGYQLCAIEYARNVLGIKDATSEEWGKGTFVVKKRKEGLNVGWHDGESYWNNYIVDLPNWEISNNFFIAQYHASYQSSLLSPHQLIVKFLQYAKMAM
jgi:CTP synthase (UTP-ammonia lyase)